MRWQWPWSALAGAVAAGLASVAWADPFGLGDAVGRVALGLMAEPAIILVEAVVYWVTLRLSWWRALCTSLLANLASYACGLLVSPFVFGLPLWARTLAGAAILLAVEVPIVLRLNRGHPDRRVLLRVAVLTNLVTYAAARLFILQDELQVFRA